MQCFSGFFFFFISIWFGFSFRRTNLTMVAMVSIVPHYVCNRSERFLKFFQSLYDNFIGCVATVKIANKILFTLHSPTTLPIKHAIEKCSILFAHMIRTAHTSEPTPREPKTPKSKSIMKEKFTIQNEQSSIHLCAVKWNTFC